MNPHQDWLGHGRRKSGITKDIPPTKAKNMRPWRWGTSKVQRAKHLEKEPRESRNLQLDPGEPVLKSDNIILKTPWRHLLIIALCCYSCSPQPYTQEHWGPPSPRKRPGRSQPTTQPQAGWPEGEGLRNSIFHYQSPRGLWDKAVSQSSRLSQQLSTSAGGAGCPSWLPLCPLKCESQPSSPPAPQMKDTWSPS